MTVRGRFFPRSVYQQLVYGALIDFHGEIKIQPPAIWKPVPLWSGKQIIPTIILNLTPKVRWTRSLITRFCVPEMFANNTIRLAKTFYVVA